ncbi:DedA family protein [Streptacidiphilus cavernicola]|uniref:DedA family protein n=1 Tax=Streptacidiphilus cavernicola TaxID=3342716 RepID=A0ABV6W0J5_9ACTN
MNWIQHLLLQLPPPAVYGAVAAVVLAESVLLLSAFAPSLTTLLVGGFLARTGTGSETVRLPLLIATAVAAVLIGDLLAQRTGRALGPRLGTGAVGRRIPQPLLRRTYRLLAARGGAAVFVCRFLPVMRTVAPHLAGAAGLRYRRIVPYSLAAGLIWASAEAGAGYALGASYTALASWATPVLGGLVAALLLTALLVSRRRNAREDANSSADRQAGAPATAPADPDADHPLCLRR